MPEAKITSKGQVTIPVEVRQALGLADGDYTSWELRPDGVLVRPMRLRPILTESAADEAKNRLDTAIPADLATVDEVADALKRHRGNE
jgi:AbrB family looped-hinge helix DNA binding protein